MLYVQVETDVHLRNLAQRRYPAPLILDQGPIARLAWIIVNGPRQSMARYSRWIDSLSGRFAQFYDLLVLLDRVPGIRSEIRSGSYGRKTSYLSTDCWISENISCQGH